VGLVSISSTTLAYRVGAGSRDLEAASFASRLPILTPAVLAAIVGLGFVALYLWRGRGPAEALALSGSFFGTVLVLTNQQIVTGWMISGRDWERYANYPLLVLGAALLALAADPSGAIPRRILPVATAAALVAGGILVGAQLRVFNAALPSNLTSVAMKRALEASEVGEPGPVKLVLAEPSLAPLLQLRVRRRLDCLLDYTRFFEKLISPLAEEGGRWGPRSPFRDRLFEHFARTGRRPLKVKRILLAELDQRTIFFLAFLFSMRDYSYAVSDDRAGREDEIRDLVPAIVEDYAAFLAAGGRWGTEPALVLTSQPPEAGSGLGPWQESVLAQGTSGQGARAVTVYAVLQTPIGRPARENAMKPSPVGPPGRLTNSLSAPSSQPLTGARGY
jgi:hypothetical protein